MKHIYKTMRLQKLLPGRSNYPVYIVLGVQTTVIYGELAFDWAFDSYGYQPKPETTLDISFLDDISAAIRQLNGKVKEKGSK